MTDWGDWEYVETYLDCDIFRQWIDAQDAYQWGSPCIIGYFWKKTAVKKRICQGQGGTWDGTSCSFEPEPIETPTTLTINAPASVDPDEAFYITGTLYETDSGFAVPGHLVSISYNGELLGSVLTGIDGEYLIQAAIPTGGTYTLTASFAGTGSLRASQSTSTLRTGTLELTSLIPVAAIALIAYMVLLKK